MARMEGASLLLPACAEPNCFVLVLVLEPARSEPVKQARKRMTQITHL